MAIFYHDNRSIEYDAEFAPFHHDMILLQSSRLTPETWRQVTDVLTAERPSSGRVVTCNWFDETFPPKRLAEDMLGLIKTLGLQSIHVVACDDAVDLVGEIEKLHPGLIEKTLLYPESLPHPEDLTRAIRDFSKT